MAAPSELNYDLKASAMEMAEAIFGNGVNVVSASYDGDRDSSGIYSGGDAISPSATPGDSGVILSTGDADDFTNRPGHGWWGNEANNSSQTWSNTKGVDNDPAMNAQAGGNTYDGAYLTADFIPDTDTLTMQFVFSSEEYPEYVGSQFNDAVVVWVNGDPVPLEVGAGDTSVGNLNQTDNQNLYVDNTDDSHNTEMDGFTVTMTLNMPVNPGEVNTIRIGIADVADSTYDSNLLIAGDSLQTEVIANADDVTIAPGGTRTVDVLSNDHNAGNGALTITHVNGTAVGAGDSVTLATGQVVTLNADGTFEVTADTDEEQVSFTYAVENGDGVSDTGFVTVDSVPCFVAGTRIMTDRGEVPVEKLAPGDLVRTLDDGLQPLRWVGRRTVAAQGRLAPVRFAAGAIGNRREIRLSPQHRVLMQTGWAELLFGEGEVLVAAKDLVNGDTITVQNGGEVEYVHILFERHQIVFSEGIETESFRPGPQAVKAFDRQVLAEICTLFPELDPETGAGYSPAARRLLKSHEAQLLVHETAAA